MKKYTFNPISFALLSSVLQCSIGCTPSLLKASLEERRDESISLSRSTSRLDSGETIQRKLISAENSQKATQIIANRISYLEMYFQDSHDPYFGTISVPADCKKKIHFSDLKMDTSKLWRFGMVPVDGKLNVGCVENGGIALILFRYCILDRKLDEVWIHPWSSTKSPKDYTCKDSLVF